MWLYQALQKIQIIPYMVKISPEELMAIQAISQKSREHYIPKV